MKIKAHKLFYLINFLQFFIMEITGTTLILFILHKGFSLKEANSILVVFFISIFILEIPTGILADKYGRKVSVLLGFICYLFYNILFMISNNYIVLLFSQVFGALSTCLNSGALESWVVDNSKEPIEVIFSTSNSIRYFSGFFCGIIGACLANIDYKLSWIISTIFVFIVISLILIFMKENIDYFKVNLDLKFKNIFMNSINIGIKNKELWIVFMIGIFISFSNSSGNTFQQPRLVGISNQGIWIMGVIKSIYSLFMVFGSYIIRKLSRNKSDNSILAYSCFMIGFWLIISGALNNFYPVLISFFIYEIGRGMYPPAKQIYLNKRLDSKYRATILSIDSALSQFGMCMGLIVTGHISKNFINLSSNQTPIKISWILCGIIALVPILLLKYSKNKETTSL